MQANMGLAVDDVIAAVPPRGPFSAHTRERWPKASLDYVDYLENCVIRTSEELTEVGRLRYNLFIERDQKPYPYADHENRCFIEPVDKYSLNFAYRSSGRISVAVRATWADDASCDVNLNLLIKNLKLNEEIQKRTIVNSRLAAFPNIESRKLIIPLFLSMYKCALRANALFCVAAARSELVPMFERFGFKKPAQINEYYNEAAGLMFPLVLDVNGREYFRKIRSLFLSVIDEANSNRNEREES